jgi:DNA polymerase elongation subunit (family B)
LKPTDGGGFIWPVICGHNVAGFDIPFIWQRCMIHGVKLPAWFPRDPKPWSDDVFDTMTRFAGARNMISMDKLCMAFNIPATDDISGADVAKAYEAGEFDKIVDHCKTDVEKVRKIHKLMERAFA